MIQVMIVEDEAPIMRSLKLAVESAHDRFEVAATAYNGQEALELLEHMSVDVLITDIRMPLMDGLELAKEVSRRYPDIQIIILSGYQEFDYARKAMELGVRQYLLKPASKSKIKQLLDTIFEEMVEKKKSRYHDHVRALINVETQADMYFTDQECYGHHLLLLCCAGLIPHFPINDDIPGKVFWEQNDLQNMLAAEVDGMGDFTILNGTTVAEKWIMISFYKNHEMPCSAREWVNRLADQLGKDLPVTICDSCYFSDIQETADVAQALKIVLNKHIRFGVTARFSICDDTDRPVYDPDPDPLIERELSLALEQLNIVFLKKSMKNLFDNWKQTQPSQNYLGQRMVRILTSLHRTLGSPPAYTSEALLEDVFSAMLHVTEYESLYHFVCRIIDSLIAQGKMEKGDRRDNEILAQQIEAYIQENFPEQLDHQLLSERFGLVPSYLSKIFSSYKGISPAKYIVQLRIEAAKDLLLEHPDLLTKDVAYVVGYTDPSYFSRIFKRETGLYPSEFRKKNGIG